MTDTTPWTQAMPDWQFELMRDIIAAPSPVGMESAMTHGVIKPCFDEFAPDTWAMHRFQGNAGVVWDTHPGQDDMFKVMIIGHADKIRMQVRKIGADGKIWINTDAFLPCTLIGHEVTLYSEDPKKPGSYRALNGGTVEALGAIHFSEPAQRTGDKGISPKQIYLELQIHGENKAAQIEQLGIRPGDTLLLNRPIKRSFSPNTFYGAYLDNGLGCFVAAEVARLVAQSGGFKKVRCMFAFASHEEIGRFGSRVMAGVLKPDAIIAVDVNHDYVAAPNIGDRNMSPLEMGKGFTLSTGAIVSEQLNARIKTTALKHDIPIQLDVCGGDTGTDGMAGVLASIDCAATSIGFPIRNMHTISESANTSDILASIHAIFESLDSMNQEKNLHESFKSGHPRLDKADPLVHRKAKNKAKKSGDKKK
ncbi:peptidase M42 [Chromatiales bacterium (ex Bugula neritina AB1)]|nr:peptidase M42 [Chromatiales bacterium (ex Bugula neritina AB1)]